MGIQKICLRNSSCGRISNSSNTKGKEVGDNPVLAADSEDDSDDGGLAALGCELGFMEGQLCSIPYELYDLPDLREILSLETWNLCLTEDERFHLSAYLPDMDQQTFCLTMKELFSGSNLFFGNPLDIFYKRLRGGYYPPRVACFREGLLRLQRRKYYHSLRSYNDRMTKMFVEMGRIGDKGEMIHDVEERICIWTKRGKQKGVNLLDLNKSPKDDNTLPEEVNLDIEKMNSLERKRAARDISPALATNGKKFASPNCRAKGVLKLKEPGSNSFQNHSLKIGASKNSEQPLSVLKGVLKIIPKGASKPIPRGALPNSLVQNQGLQDFKSSSFPASWPLQDTDNQCIVPYPKQHFDGHKINSRESQCLESQLGSILGVNHLSEYTRTIENEMCPSADDISILGRSRLFAGGMRKIAGKECKSLLDPMGSREYKLGSENMLPGTGAGDIDLPLRFLESFPFDFRYHGKEQPLALFKQDHNNSYPTLPEVVPRILDAGNSKAETMMESFTKQYENDAISRKSKTQSGKSSVSDGFKLEPVLPLTYKRRKALAKINLLDHGKPQTAGADLKPAVSKESN